MLEEPKAAILFELIDHDKDQHVSKKELFSFMKGLGGGLTDPQLEDLFSSMDTDGDGRLDFKEFQVLMNKWVKCVVKSDSAMKQSDFLREDGMKLVLENLAKRVVLNPEKPIHHVVLIVVVYEEIKPVLEKFCCVRNEEITKEFINLAVAYSAKVEGAIGSYDLTVLQVGQHPIYHRHNSGYAQSAAIAGLAAKILSPDLIISFGTGGGCLENDLAIGDAVLATGTIFMDRFRTSNKNAFDWGVYGGLTMPTKKMSLELGLREGIVGSQGSYDITEVQVELMKLLKVLCLDMEAASESMILQQTGVNFMALKVVSNGIYPGDGKRMEDEYVIHREEVSKRGVTVLSSVLAYFMGKKLGDL